MNEPATESEDFLDARPEGPETLRLNAAAHPDEEASADDIVFTDHAEPGAEEARSEEGVEEEQPQDEGVLFADAADGSEGPAPGAEAAPAHTPPPQRPKALRPRPGPRAPAPGSAAAKNKTTGRHRPPTGRLSASSASNRVSSSRNRMASAEQLSSSDRLQALSSKGADWTRRKRTPEEDAEALSRLLDRAVVPSPRDPFLGEPLGPYLPERLLEEERGMRTYVARAEEGGERVLLRVLRLKGPHGRELTRLAEQAERAARVVNPGLALTLGSGRGKDLLYLAYQLPLGASLEELLAAGEALGEDEVATLVDQVSRALAALHSRQLVHGDVCLRTIRRERPGCFVLEGAGLSRARPELGFLTGAGEVLGTPGFVAPEALDTGNVTPSADLYSLGCVAWALLAGKRPVTEDDPAEALVAHLARGPLPPLPVGGRPVSPAMALIVHKLTGTSPAARYPEVADLHSDLRSRAAGEAVKPLPPVLGAGDREKPHQPINAATLLLVLLFILDLAVAMTLGIIYYRARMVRVSDPVAGYELPMPGISQGGLVAPPEQDPRAFFRREGRRASPPR